jgi:Domain of unknown function (DUF4203)
MNTTNESEIAPFAVVYYVILAFIGVLGLVFLSIGTKIFKVALFIVGFIIGAGITWSLFSTFNVALMLGQDRLFLVLFVPCIVGAIIGLIVQRLVKTGIFIAGFGIGLFAGTTIVSSISIPLAGWILTLIVFGSSLILGGAMLLAKDIVITVISAAIGSFFITVCLDGLISKPRVYSKSVETLLTYMDTDTMHRYLNLTIDNSTAPAILSNSAEGYLLNGGISFGYIICSVVLVVLFLLSVWFQYWFFHVRPYRSSKAEYTNPNQSNITTLNEGDNANVPDELSRLQRLRKWFLSSPMWAKKSVGPGETQVVELVTVVPSDPAQTTTGAVMVSLDQPL